MRNGYTHQVSQNYYFFVSIVPGMMQNTLARAHTHTHKDTVIQEIQKMMVLGLRDLTV